MPSSMHFFVTIFALGWLVCNIAGEETIYVDETLAEARPVDKFYGIRYVRLNDAELVETSRSNYAITSPAFAKNNWTSVSVNDETVVFYKTTCEFLTRELQSLDEEELKLIEIEREKLVNVEMHFVEGLPSTSIRYFGGFNKLIFSQSEPIETFTSRYLFSVDFFDGDHYTAHKRAFPNGVKRFFVIGNLIALIFKDHSIRMIPSVCLFARRNQSMVQLPMNATRGLFLRLVEDNKQARAAVFRQGKDLSARALEFKEIARRMLLGGADHEELILELDSKDAEMQTQIGMMHDLISEMEETIERLMKTLDQFVQAGCENTAPIRTTAATLSER